MGQFFEDHGKGKDNDSETQEDQTSLELEDALPEKPRRTHCHQQHSRTWCAALGLFSLVVTLVAVATVLGIKKSTTDAYSITTTIDTRVTSIDETHTVVQSGTISTEIGLLTSLTDLCLHDTALTGTIPSEIGLLTDLSFVTLYNNSLTGSIPTQIAQLTNLNLLYLANNSLTGRIPSELGLLAEDVLLPDPNALDTQAIHLNWPMLMYRNLVWLLLQDNHLSGSIPSELGALTQLKHLKLSNNSLTGTIPEDLVRIPNLGALTLEHNRLTGTVPDLPFSLYCANLLEGNSLSGVYARAKNLPSCAWLGTSNYDMVTPVSNPNAHNGAAGRYSGKLATDLALLTSLTELSFGGESLTGTIPTELGLLTNLKYMYLYSNHLTGTLPSQLGLLTALSYLYIYDNWLSGSIPKEIESLVELQDIRLYNNSFTGTIPSSICNVPFCWVVDGTSLVAPEEDCGCL